MDVIDEGDRNGYGLTARFTLSNGREIGVVGLPHPYPTRTGPTWSYLVECQGWTLIDAGPIGALPTLEIGLKSLGHKLENINNLIITHGHQDHDGNAYDFLKASGAELWAHELYFSFISLGQPNRLLDTSSPLHRVLKDARSEEENWYRKNYAKSDHSKWMNYYKRYMGDRKKILDENLPAKYIHDLDEIDDLTFLHTPGHAIDEICVTSDGAIFTGDHVLPQISPHPTHKQPYPDQILDTIPSQYRDSSKYYGLAPYLRSLGKVLALDNHITLFPAHRLFSNNRFHLRNIRRAQDLVRHHSKRLQQIKSSIEDGATTIQSIARSVFPARKLTGGAFFGALSEIVSHLELLQDTGDILIAENYSIKAKEPTSFLNAISQITNQKI